MYHFFKVEGGYIQGIGYFTCEKLLFDKETGKLLTNRSLTYHVPLALDIPCEFNVKLRYNSKNPKGVLGSKSEYTNFKTFCALYWTYLVNICYSVFSPLFFHNFYSSLWRNGYVYSSWRYTCSKIMYHGVQKRFWI